MSYGKTAGKIFAVVGVAMPLLFILRGGWGSLFGTFVRWLVVACPPLALGFSVAGVVRDDRKPYAITMLLVSGAFTLLLVWALILRAS